MARRRPSGRGETVVRSPRTLRAVGAWPAPDASAAVGICREHGRRIGLIIDRRGSGSGFRSVSDILDEMICGIGRTEGPGDVVRH